MRGWWTRGIAMLAVAVATAIASPTAGAAPRRQDAPPVFVVASGSPIAVADFPVAVATGDFDGDGKPDFVVETKPSGTNAAGSLTAYLGNGDGSFHPSVTQSVPNATYFDRIAVGDFNRDGKLDLALTTSGGAIVLLGNGNGAFHPAPASSPALASYPTIGDLNGDGIPDLVASVYGSAKNTFSVYLGVGDGSFRLAPSLPTADVSVGLVALIHDLNGDGIPDLVFAASESVTSPRNGTRVLLGNGNGTFRLGSFIPSSGSYGGGAVALGKFAGNDTLDLLTSDGTVLRSNGDGTFTIVATTPDVFLPVYTVVADFDGDGKLDVAKPDGSREYYVYLLVNNGDGTFAPPSRAAQVHGPDVLGVGDFDGDGRLDLVAITGTSAVSVLLNHGRAAGQLPPSPGRRVSSVTDAAQPAAAQPSYPPTPAATPSHVGPTGTTLPKPTTTPNPLPPRR